MVLSQELGVAVGLLLVGLFLGFGLAYFMGRQKAAALLDKTNAETALQLKTLEAAQQHLEEKYRQAQLDLTSAETDSRDWQGQYHKESNRNAQLQQEVLQVQALEARLASLQEENAGLQQSLKLEHGKCTELQAKLDASQQELREKLKLLNEAKEQLKTEFQNIANQLFESKSEKFTAQNKNNMDQILTPLREQLSDFKKRVEDVYDKESKERVSLLKEITNLKTINSQMSEDALKLTKALKGDNKIQGNWGEMVLERVLETSGLRKGIEYETQVSLKGEAGERKQPDVIVRLPENKDIVIDSKVSLVAWEAYCSADSEEEKHTAQTALLQSLKEHVRQLSGKDYSNLEGIRTLDFVLLFVPIEGAFLKVLENDTTLFSDAFEKNIMIVSPSTLLVTLRTIQNIWRYEYQNRNALEIAKSAGGLHDQFVLFVESLEDIGANLDKAQLAYDTAYKRLATGRGNLVRRTIQLEKMGAKAKKNLPDKLLEQASEEIKGDVAARSDENALPLFED
ncbi:MAG: DNA recombination protein RmuC [Pseudomonadales bacterium]|nr:DNA recombination protein RmuC [Pseudomonadales bacterium]